MRRIFASPRCTRSSAVVALLTFATVALACSPASSDASNNAADPTLASAAGAEANAPPAGESKETIHMVVTGGPNAGTYDVDMDDTGCSYGLAGPTAWGNQYSIDTDDAKQFSSLQMIVPDAKAAASGTQDFELTAGFGALFGGGASYNVDTRTDAPMKTGSGQVTVQDQGETGTVTFDATTDDGVELKGTIQCLSVIRAG